MKFEDLTDQKFGRLTVLRRNTEKRITRWLCKCDCGSQTVVHACHLKRGATLSCGCFRNEVTSKNRLTHGYAATRPYHAWMHMMQRCYNPKASHFKDYGGRGIRVYPPWHTFENFWKDMNRKFEVGLELDRIDNNGHYSPTNCRWATRIQQTQNTRTNRLMSTPNGTMCVSEAARQFGIIPSTLHGRLRRGLSDYEALGIA